MDYQRVTETRLTILYTLHVKRLGCYFACDIVRSLNISIDESSV